MVLAGAAFARRATRCADPRPHAAWELCAVLLVALVPVAGRAHRVCTHGHKCAVVGHARRRHRRVRWPRFSRARDSVQPSRSAPHRARAADHGRGVARHRGSHRERRRDVGDRGVGCVGFWLARTRWPSQPRAWAHRWRGQGRLSVDVTNNAPDPGLSGERHRPIPATALVAYLEDGPGRPCRDPEAAR